ncbi:hypothetical protein BRW62_05455 [Parathermosynechococcus lividus PCC 6715]|uniref:Uncharacterized protein n=1 Tax=Parathermosynechococcus lividus PCC 6715 TaxID=1917166 RepID=A0A2D2Q1A3_PARLV|nr:hypothetical protein BRW62_05455 [Thermostichus lividus PCC 6715]
MPKIKNRWAAKTGFKLRLNNFPCPQLVEQFNIAIAFPNTPYRRAPFAQPSTSAGLADAFRGEKRRAGYNLGSSLAL